MKQVFWKPSDQCGPGHGERGEIRVHLERDRRTAPLPSIRRVHFPPGQDMVEYLGFQTRTSIPVQEKEKIFDPFYTTKDGGTGLGLSIVHKIIESHRG